MNWFARRGSRLPPLLIFTGIAAISTACGNEGGFRDTGPTLVDAGFGPEDAQPAVDMGFPDVDPGVDTGVLDADVDAGPVDTGPPVDGGPNTATFSEQSINDRIVHGQGVEVVDIDNDNDLDVVVALSLTDAVHVYLNDGSGGGWQEVVVGTNIVAMEVEVADLDGDNDLDIAAVGLFDRSRGFESPGEVAWFENPGNVTGAWTTHRITGFNLWGARFVEAGDVTGDGLADLVVGANEMNESGQTRGNGLYWFRNTGLAGANRFSGPNTIDATLVDVLAVALHDVDENQTLDIIALGRGSNEVAWWSNGRDPGTPNTTPPLTKHVIATPPAPFDMRLADMDGDGPLELVVTMTDGNGGAVRYYDPPANAAGRTDAWTEVSIAADFGGGLNSRLYAADLNGDQRTDVAVGAGEQTTIRVFFQGDNRAFTSQLVRTGYTGLNWLTGGDLNGDGRNDLVTATYEFTSGQDLVSWWTNQPQ